MINQIETLLIRQFEDDSHRLKHIFGVRSVAVELARIHHANVYEVEVASLLHDVMKNASYEAQLDVIKDPVVIDYFKDVPVAYHAAAGYYYAKDNLGITNPTILEAIFYHMWGKIDMSLETMIVCVSDFCEPNRIYPKAKEIYKLAKVDIELAFIEAIGSTIDYLRKQGVEPFKDQLKIYEYYTKKKGLV